MCLMRETSTKILEREKARWGPYIYDINPERLR